MSFFLWGKNPNELYSYGVATVSRIDQIIGLSCRILSLLSGSFPKETYHFIDPTNQSHPILHRILQHSRPVVLQCVLMCVLQCVLQHCIPLHLYDGHHMTNASVTVQRRC